MRHINYQKNILVYHIIMFSINVFFRYCNKSNVETIEEKNVCVFFRNVCSVKFINACLSILDSYTKNVFFLFI